MELWQIDSRFLRNLAIYQASANQTNHRMKRSNQQTAKQKHPNIIMREIIYCGLFMIGLVYRLPHRRSSLSLTLTTGELTICTENRVIPGEFKWNRLSQWNFFGKR